MLADPRSEALVSNFAQQLLYLRNLPATSPDGIFYPNWDDELRQAFSASRSCSSTASSARTATSSIC